MGLRGGVAVSRGEGAGAGAGADGEKGGRGGGRIQGTRAAQRSAAQHLLAQLRRVLLQRGVLVRLLRRRRAHVLQLRVRHVRRAVQWVLCEVVVTIQQQEAGLWSGRGVETEVGVFVCGVLPASGPAGSSAPSPCSQPSSCPSAAADSGLPFSCTKTVGERSSNTSLNANAPWCPSDDRDGYYG